MGYEGNSMVFPEGKIIREIRSPCQTILIRSARSSGRDSAAWPLFLRLERGCLFFHHACG